ncbi:MAG: kelch repeat-containing protein [Planctomycetota bacterium]
MTHRLSRSRFPLALLFTTALAGPAAAQTGGFWEFRPSLAIARQEVGAAVLDGKVYVAGGILAGTPVRFTPTVEVYDPATQTWSSIADLPTSLHHFGMATVGGKLYVIGGYVTTFTGTDACYSWDPATGIWTSIADLPQPRGALVAAAIGGKIYAAGGVHPTRGVVGDLTEYDPATDTWRTLPPMPTPREHLSAASLGGLFYAAGGRAGGRLFNELEAYDPTTNVWTSLRPMPTARGGNGAATLAGKLIVIGGEGSGLPGGNFPQTEEYDVATNAWRTRANMRVPLHGIYPVTIDDEIFVAGGGTVQGLGATTTVIAFRNLPSGVTPYGTSTPACFGAIDLLVNAPPTTGNPEFAFVSSPTAPAGAAGLLVLGGAPDAAGTPFLGLQIHVALAGPLLLLPVTAGAGRVARAPVLLPAAASGGTLFAQMLLANPAGCAPNFSASDGLSVRVR